MGQYEPTDSRTVTLDPKAAPGEPPRTGPREDESRKESDEARTARKARDGEETQRADDAIAKRDGGLEDENGQQQADEVSPSLTSGPYALMPQQQQQGAQLQQQVSDGAQPGDQQQGDKADTGTARPEYDQYEVNQSTSLNKKAKGGYGNASTEDGEEEADMADAARGSDDDIDDAAPDQARKAMPGETSDRPDVHAKADAARPLGKD